jgi:hypothetical protein
MNGSIRIYRPPPRKQHRRKPQTGQERLAQAVRDGEADGKRWAQRKHRRGDLFIGAYFTAYFEAFSRAVNRAFEDVMRILPPPIITNADGQLVSTATGEVVGIDLTVFRDSRPADSGEDRS